jgi:hypothetical protein
VGSGFDKGTDPVRVSAFGHSITAFGARNRIHVTRETIGKVRFRKLVQDWANMLLNVVVKGWNLICFNRLQRLVCGGAMIPIAHSLK